MAAVKQSTNTSTSRANDTWEKGKFILNAYITDRNGNQHQYGLMPLRESDKLHVALMTKKESMTDEEFQLYLRENTTFVVREVKEKAEVEL